MSWLSSLLDRVDSLPERALLLIDLCIGLFALVAHGGALILVRLGKAPMFEQYAVWLLVSVVGFGCVVVSSTLAFFWERGRRPILAAHAVVLLGLAVALVGWAVGLVLNGIPTEVNFSWSPGLFTALVFYGVYLFRRLFLLGYVSASPLARHCHVAAALVAAALELGVLVRLFLRFRSFAGGFPPAL